MKKENGVTLISLIMYVIMMTFVVSAVTAITTSFNKNLSEVDDNAESAVAYSRFNMYFLHDIKSEGVSIAGSSDDHITLGLPGSTSTTYRIDLDAGTLYKDKIKICDGVKDAKITVNGKEIQVYLKIKNYEKTTDYKLEPKISTTAGEPGL